MFSREGEKTHRDRHTGGESLVKTEAGMMGMQLQATNTKECRPLPEARKRQERVQENRLQRKHGPVDLDLNF